MTAPLLSDGCDEGVDVRDDIGEECPVVGAHFTGDPSGT